jgi:hypothetical protein
MRKQHANIMRAAEMYFRNASVEKKNEIRCQYLYLSTSKARKLSTSRKARLEQRKVRATRG